MENLNIIVAYDKNRAIGYSGDLLWKRGEKRDDMKHFKDLTINSTVVMGRKTLESIGIALPNRRNIVLTKKSSIDIPGIEIAHSLDEAYEMSHTDKQIYVIGGGEIYQQAIRDVEKIYATEIDALINPADTYFPDLDKNWQITNIEEHELDDRNKYAYNFVTYERK